MQAIYSASGVTQVNIPASTGDMGILANHVASIEALRPGVVEVIEEGGKVNKWFGECRRSGHGGLPRVSSTDETPAVVQRQTSGKSLHRQWFVVITLNLDQLC